VQVRQHLQRFFPNLEVLGAPYPTPPLFQVLSQLVFVFQLALIGGLMFGEAICNMIGRPAPAWFQELGEKKFAIGATIWFLGNTIAQNLVKTNAFEIAANGQLIHSSLSRGGLPSMEQILGGVEQVIGKASQARFVRAA